MKSHTETIRKLAQAFEIPIVGDRLHIWFVRTQSGSYYFDFYWNQYIALGWDEISSELMEKSTMSYASKRDVVSEHYPDEKRPGLILGQMETFYNKMEIGDLVVIPDIGGKRIAIGVLGGITTTVSHKYYRDEYECCEYKHKRSVTWIKQIDLWSDVYLFRVLRAQQTISDITEYAEMVYRNIYPCYISDDGFHLTFQKVSTADFSIKNNVDLQLSILKINEVLAEYYETEDLSDAILVKTAVGSPGFIEVILPYIPVSIMAGVFIYRGIVGKVKSKDGEESTGIMAILTKGNELINDHKNRKKVDAEIKQIEANTEKTKMESALVKAQTRKLNAEAETIEIKNEKDKLVVAHIAENTTTIISATTQSGIGFDKSLDEVS